jgi:hypothetical protein
MKGVILQPGYIPWLGFFNQMIQTDLFVYYDDVQYDRRGWRNRNQIKGPETVIMLTVPVIQKGLFTQLLLDTSIDNTMPWAKKHLLTIQRCYAKSPFFKEYFPELESILNQTWENLLDLDLRCTNLFRKWLGINTPVMQSSSLPSGDNDKTGRLVEICKAAGITEYISGPLCKNYIDSDQMTKSGITLLLHEYHHPVYNQRFPPFVSHLSCLDLIMNEGPESLGILRDDNSLEEFTA